MNVDAQERLFGEPWGRSMSGSVGLSADMMKSQVVGR